MCTLASCHGNQKPGKNVMGQRFILAHGFEGQSVVAWPHALGQKNIMAAGTHGGGYLLTAHRTARREIGRP